MAAITPEGFVTARIQRHHSLWSLVASSVPTQQIGGLEWGTFLVSRSERAFEFCQLWVSKFNKLNGNFQVEISNAIRNFAVSLHDEI